MRNLVPAAPLWLVLPVPFERLSSAAAEGTPIAAARHFPLEGGSKPEGAVLFSNEEGADGWR